MSYTDDDLSVLRAASRDIFLRLAAEFSFLTSSFRDDLPEVEFQLSFDTQPRLPFPVRLWFSGDELCLGAGEAFWCEWFPASRSTVRNEFEKIAQGLISGEFRLVESSRNGSIFEAQIEEVRGGEWCPVSSWSKLRLPSLARSDKRVLRAEPQ